MHVRKRIRLAAAQSLTNLPTTQDRVYPGRVRPLGASADPALFIYSLEEDSDISTTGTKPILERNLQLAIEGRISIAGGVDPEDLLDQIAVEVETTLGNAPPLGGLVVEMTLVRSRLDIAAQGENLIGSIIMQFRVQYRTGEGAPETAL